MSSTWPPRTRPLDVVDAGVMSRDGLQRYRRRATPVIVRGFIPARVCALADPKALVEDAGGEKITFMRNIPQRFLEDFSARDRVTTTMRDFVAYLESPERKLPCYANQQPIARFPRLKAELTYESLLPGLRPGFVWVGSAGSNIGLHFDPADGFLAQLSGRKSFYLLRHADSGDVYPLPDDLTRSRVDLREVDRAAFPRLWNVAPYAGTLEAGDLLYIPRYTWHYFWGVTTSVSTNVFDGPWLTAPRIANLLRMYGPGYARGVAKQLVAHGLRGQPYEQRGYGWPPAGLIVWRMLVGEEPLAAPRSLADAARGEVRGRAQSVLRVLRARGLEVPESLRARIAGCTDLPTLDRWLTLAATAADADAFAAGL
jgi:hypothetical protein